MVWCSQGTTEGASNRPLSVLGFHDGMVLTGHHRGRQFHQLSVLKLDDGWCSQGTTEGAGNHQL